MEFDSVLLVMGDKGGTFEKEGEVRGEVDELEEWRSPGVSRGIRERMGEDMPIFIAAERARFSLATVALRFATFW